MTYHYKRYTKDDVAARLLESALELHLSGGDGFAVVHLAAASEEILSGLIKGRRVPSVVPTTAEKTAREQSIDALVEIHKIHGTARTVKEIGSYINRVRNQTKHYDEETDSRVISLSLDLEVEMGLHRAIDNYIHYFGNPSETIVRFIKMKSSSQRNFKRT
jgi:hypothetical protein